MNEKDIHSSVLLVDLRISQWTARKMDKRVGEEVAAKNHVDSRVGNYYKSLLDPAVIKAISKVVNEARTYHYKVTLPWSDDGPRVLPSKLYFEYTTKMRGFTDLFTQKVSELLQDYPYHREEAKRYLGGLFKEEDYPTPDKLSDKYAFSVRFLPLPKGSDFRCDIPGEELEKIREQVEGQTQATMARAMEEAFERVHKVVSAYVDRLAETDSIFRDSLVGNARELVELLPALNVTGDERLTQITERLRDELTQYDPQVLRTNMGARKQAHESAKQIVSEIENVFGGGA